MPTNDLDLTSETVHQCGDQFSRTTLEDWIAKTPLGIGREIRIDFSNTRWFDIASLVFLLCILSNWRSQGEAVTLRLPDSAKHRRARDFLCRWNFREGLRLALDNEIANLLQTDQLSYFDGPLDSYTPTQVVDEYGDLAVLSSLQLLQITSLTDLQEDGNYRVSFSRIGQVTNRACARALYSALKTSIGAPHKWATQFGRVLIHQGLLNAFEHPEASVAFIAMARQGPHLVIGIADNGLTIPATIAEAYEQSKEGHVAATKELSGYQLDANRIAYATFRGTSRKPLSIADPDRGMGLYYIKTLTAEVGGYLRIRASEASVKFSRSEGHGPIQSSPEPVKRLERGNLLKIVLPLAKERGLAKSH
ncbi:MAG TPA: hypothetical protein VMV72_04895 [Verrucomicrobiae bacterium]|nr:hypothetical protein [Verrucomicrobiae bacterium]